MCPSSWNLYLDDFPFFGSPLAHQEPKLEVKIAKSKYVRTINKLLLQCNRQNVFRTVEKS